MIMMKEFVSLTMVALEGEKDTFSVVEIVVKCGNASWKKMNILHMYYHRKTELIWKALGEKKCSKSNPKNVKLGVALNFDCK